MAGQKRSLLVFVASVSLAGICLTHAQARNQFLAKVVDRNKDGLIDKKEIKIDRTIKQQQRSRVTNWWERHADANADGRVDAQEYAAWKSLENAKLDYNRDGVIDSFEQRRYWKNSRTKVNTALEKSFDADADGWLNEQEAAAFLRYRHGVVMSEGKAIVDSVLEEAYDTDGDGLINRAEAIAMQDDISS
ncbi:MAG: hypothetical protein KBA46_07220 [Candidatus Omnitrophica bacterium]|nr:hypothetical protein [Candidatus Omnitrophota bacterium]